MKTSGKQLAVGALLACAFESAFALGIVSRACNFSTLPDVLKAPPAILLLRNLGMPEAYLTLYKQPTTEQKLYWALESITTDYGLIRYYLFAENRIYRLKYFGPTAYDYGWFFEANYRSPYAAQSLPPEILNNTDLSAIYNFNRRVSSSVRAGHPDIFQRYDKVFAIDNGMDVFWVLGKHWYFDPVSKSQSFLGTTDVQSDRLGCNLTNFGFGDR